MLGPGWQDPREGFSPIREDEYDSEPPPAYSKTGPGPGPLGNDGGGGSGSSSAACRYGVRDTQRRRSFGIGGAGNIRTTKETAIVALPLVGSTASASADMPANQAERRGSASSSGANELRDKLVGGVKTIFGAVTSNGGARASGGESSPSQSRGDADGQGQHGGSDTKVG